eukprot:Gregarina_sp_Poly_1__4004@NODE_2209_length_2485_cov_8_150538_g1424_i0_p1_GENE_NODE_2209_length_2485_cov_8_150538_g1424_i0NODE_2209_length_2485_cov_8_150538_g1424_i0_p1_ORF_typecomplete_len595_score89_08_NODE_2209_length_2485_cov_8_150538_g1424_i05192303
MKTFPLGYLGPRILLTAAFLYLPQAHVTESQVVGQFGWGKACYCPSGWFAVVDVPGNGHAEARCLLKVANIEAECRHGESNCESVANLECPHPYEVVTLRTPDEGDRRICAMVWKTVCDWAQFTEEQLGRRLTAEDNPEETPTGVHADLQTEKGSTFSENINLDSEDISTLRGLAKAGKEPVADSLLHKLQQKLKDIKYLKEEKQLARSENPKLAEFLTQSKIEQLDSFKQLLQEKKLEFQESKKLKHGIILEETLIDPKKNHKKPSIIAFNKPSSIKRKTISADIIDSGATSGAFEDTDIRKEEIDPSASEQAMGSYQNLGTNRHEAELAMQFMAGTKNDHPNKSNEPYEGLDREYFMTPNDFELQSTLADQTQTVNNIMREYLGQGGGDLDFDIKLSQFFKTVIESIELAMRSNQSDPPLRAPTRRSPVMRRASQLHLRYPSERASEDYQVKNTNVGFISNLDDLGLLVSSDSRWPHREAPPSSSDAYEIAGVVPYQATALYEDWFGRRAPRATVPSPPSVHPDSSSFDFAIHRPSSGLPPSDVSPAERETHDSLTHIWASDLVDDPLNESLHEDKLQHTRDAAQNEYGQLF